MSPNPSNPQTTKRSKKRPQRQRSPSYNKEVYDVKPKKMRSNWSTTIIVRDPPAQLGEQDLTSYFSKFGDINELKIVSNTRAGKLNRFSVVKFAKEIPSSVFEKGHSIKKILLDIREYYQYPPDHGRQRPKNGHNSYEHSSYDLKEDTPPPEQPKYSEDDREIFVGGIPMIAKDGDLQSYFSKFGQVKVARISTNPETKQSRGFGFVRFENVDAVKKVIENRSVHKIRGKWVLFRFDLRSTVRVQNQRIQ